MECKWCLSRVWGWRWRRLRASSPTSSSPPPPTVEPSSLPLSCSSPSLLPASSRQAMHRRTVTTCPAGSKNTSVRGAQPSSTHRPHTRLKKEKKNDEGEAREDEKKEKGKGGQEVIEITKVSSGGDIKTREIERERQRQQRKTKIGKGRRCFEETYQ